MASRATKKPGGPPRLPGNDPTLVPRREITGAFVLMADCEVIYEGRASSTLQRGRYLLIRKADGTFLVHGASLTVPLNYQPAGCRLFRTPEGYLCRGKRETMRVILYAVLARLPSGSWDDHRIRLVRTERELRDRLARRLSAYIPGLARIHKEYPTTYGAADLVAVDRRGVWHVVEVKRGRATVQAGVQLRKYVEALTVRGRRVRGYVAAPALAANAAAYYQSRGYTYLPVRHAKPVKRPAACAGGLTRRGLAG